LVSKLLQEPIACYILRVLRPVSLIVIPVLLHPALVAFLLVLAVVRVGLHFLALPAPFPQPPALLPAAISVVLYARIGDKKPSAVGIGAPDLLGHGFCLQEKNHDLIPSVNVGEEQESDQKKMGHKLTGRQKEYPRKVFPDRPTIGTYSPAKTREFFTGGNKIK
jgi:hypothetical protein